MSNTMSVEELQQYMTVAEKNKIFVEEYQPKGMFMKSSHYWEHTKDGSYIVFEVQVLGRNSKGEEFFMVNGTAAENMSGNKDRVIDAFRFCETSSRGRALGALGIGLDAGMSSRDDLECGIDYRGPQVVENVPAPSKVRVPSIVQNLGRMKLDFETTDKTFIIKKSDVKPKSATVLKRYGFKLLQDKYICERDDV